MRSLQTIFPSAAFVTQANDILEELLKQLSDVEVDEDGTIKAQRKKAERIFVEGKEFFGDDPQIATKNLLTVSG